MKSLTRVFLLILFVASSAFMVAACTDRNQSVADADGAPATATPTHTATVAPTDTPSPTPIPPTDTPVPPTATPEPTATPTPEPTPTPTPVPPSLRLTVLSETDDAPLAGIRVTLTGQEHGATFAGETDAAGVYTVDVLESDVFDVTIEGEGFTTVELAALEIDGPVAEEVQLASAPVAQVMVNSAILRDGPGTAYARVGAAEAEQTLPIVGQDESGEWYVVTWETDGEAVDAWIAAEVTELIGALDETPVVEAPPPPIAAAPADTSGDEGATSEGDEAPGEGEDGDESYGWVELYYVSNPNELLGVFPEQPFDADLLYTNMVTIQSALGRMQGALAGALAGDAAACATYIQAYDSVYYSGVFFTDVPGDWTNQDFVYVISFIYALDRTRPAYLSCVNAGRVDQFNHDLAYGSINETLQFMNPTLAEVAARLGR